MPGTGREGKLIFLFLGTGRGSRQEHHDTKEGVDGCLTVGRIASMKEERRKVACIGDSITYGYQIRDRSQTYPGILQGLLGEGCSVRNFGNSGRGILRKARKLDEPRAFMFMPQHRQALEWKPDVVICNLGINDLIDWDQLGHEFIADYRALLAEYRALAGIPRMLIWHRLAPLFPGHPFHGDERVEAVNGRIAEVARLEAVETIEMEDPLRGHREWFPDKLHPNEAGAAEIARVTAEYLQRGD